MVVIADITFVVWRCNKGDLSRWSFHNWVAAEHEKSSDEGISQNQS
jgi:hypothetical protein